MSFIFDEGIAKAIERLEDPDRIKRHDPYFVLRETGLKRGDILADIGCGTGFFAIPAASIVGDAGLVYAVDRVVEVLEVLERKVHERKIHNIRIIKADATSTKIPSNHVDAVLLANILHDLPAGALGRELKRIMKQRGRVSVVDWIKVPTDKGPPVEHRLTEEEASKALNDMGFRVERVYRAGPSHYGIVSVSE